MAKPITANVREIVQTTFMNHPGDCIFIPGAVDSITEKLLAAKHTDVIVFIDHCEKLFNEHEIYCPHEGIDRRAEFGMEIT